MPLVRIQVSTKSTVAALAKNAIVNTLYFNVSGSVEPPNYQNLVNDVYALWGQQSWGQGRYTDVRAYNMADAEPRPQKAIKVGQQTGTRSEGAPQIALCLSYYADRNLPRQRGRIYLGPWSAATLTERPTSVIQNNVLAFGQGLSAIGGLNVDWSLYSPTTSTNTRISNIWVDDSWDVIRSRKLPSGTRVQAEING